MCVWWRGYLQEQAHAGVQVSTLQGGADSREQPVHCEGQHVDLETTPARHSSGMKNVMHSFSRHFHSERHMNVCPCVRESFMEMWGDGIGVEGVCVCVCVPGSP